MTDRKSLRRLAIAVALAAFTLPSMVAARDMDRPFNGPYEGTNLNRVAFPIGGIGTGMYCLEGTGAISHMSVDHQLNFFHEPFMYAAVCVLGNDGGENTARILEGPIPDWKYFGLPMTGRGGGTRTYGFPRFRECRFEAEFPFATIGLKDHDVPLDVRITGWSPFTPPDADSSSLPVGAIEYRFKNTSNTAQKAVFSFNSQNFMATRDSRYVQRGSIGPIEGGFVLYSAGGRNRDDEGAFAIFVDGEEVIVDHCWFQGRAFDTRTITWENVQRGTLLDNPPTQGNAIGASLFVPFELQPGEEKTIRVLTAWYVPKSDLASVSRRGGPAFDKTPSRGNAPRQKPVSGFLGKGLANSYDSGGDTATGTLTSPEFTVDRRYLHFLVGGGSHVGETCVELLVDGEVAQSATGKDSETLAWATFDLASLRGRKARIRIADRATGSWGHVLADHFILSNEPIDNLRAGGGNAVTNDATRVTVLADFEGDGYGDWIADHVATEDDSICTSEVCVVSTDPIPDTYVPWYATQFDSIQDVANAWKSRYDELRRRSVVFRDAFQDTTLPPEVVEATAANLTILKSPTVLRQHDGRLWCWEGCSDDRGCCPGSCTHVWNYAQALCHLFPALERTLRQNEFFEGQDATGRQAFRGNLPITPGGRSYDAADGQLGGIMKAYREWRASGNRKWLVVYWPRIKQSLDYMIEKWDPRHTGMLEESHHNTYDISYYGPDGHCGSFYLGALAAAIKMGEEMGDDVSFYRELIEKGRRRMETELFNGEYFIQVVTKEGLDRNFQPINPNSQSRAYRNLVGRINEQGPKYQYGAGCLSDGVLGLWMAKACGIDDEIVDTEKVQSHLKAVHKYNLKHDLSAHANPQRPSYAMGDDGGLLLCSWPRGEKPLLPFVYSDEVWTGIEYQVASHLMLMGCVDEGLDIVRECRKRHDGVRRNPFNEYECGHWYARAMSSYGLIQGLTGLRYDAVTRTLHVDSKVGDFRAFLATEGGFGTVELKNGKVSLEVKAGQIPVEKTVVQ